MGKGSLRNGASLFNPSRHVIIMVKARKVLYVVKRILDKKEKNGKSLYLVRWKGFGAKDDTWEPEASLSEVRSLIDAYEEKAQPPKTPPPKTKSLPKPTISVKPTIPAKPISTAPVRVAPIQGAFDIDEVEKLSGLMWRPVQHVFVCEVHYKSRVSGMCVQNSVETLADVRYRCPQLAVDLLLASLKPGPQ